MANVVTVQATLTGDASSLLKALTTAANATEQVGESASKADSKGKGAWSSFTGALGKVGAAALTATGLVGGIVSGAAVTKGVQRLAAIQDSTVALTTMLGSATAAADLTAKALQVVQGTPFAFPQFAQATQQLIAFGVQAAVVPGVLTAIADAAAASGQGSQGVDQLTFAFSNLASQGKMTGDTVQSFASSGVNAVGILANHFHVTTDEARDMISKGLIPADAAMQILTDGIENGSTGAAGSFAKMAGAAQGIGGTISGSLGNLQAAFARMGASAVKPFQDDIPKVINGTLIPVFDTVGKWLNDLGTKVASNPAFTGFIDWLGKIPGMVAGVLAPGGQMAALFDTLKGIFTTLAPLLSPINVAIQLIGAAMPAAAAGMGPLVSALTNLAQQVIPPLAAALAAIETALAKAFAGAAPAAIAAIVAVLNTLVPILAAVLTWVSQNAALVIKLGAAIAGVVVVVNAWKAATSAAAAVSKAWAATQAVMTAAGVAYRGVVEGMTAAQAIATATTKGSTAANVAARVAAIAGAAAMGIATAAQWAWNAAMDANPIMLIVLAVAAVIAIIVLLITHWQDVMNIVGQVGDFIVGVWNNVMSFLGTVFSAIGEWVNTYIVTPWMNGFNQLVGFIQAFVAVVVAVWNTITAPIIAVWNGIVAVIQWVWNLIYTIVVAGVTLIVAGIMMWLQPMIDWWMATWQAISDFLATVWNAIASWISGVVMAVVDAIMTPIMAVVNWWNATWASIQAVIGVVWTWIVAFVTAYINMLVSIVRAVMTTVSSVWNSIWNGISSFVSGVWNTIVGAVRGQINTVMSIIQTVGRTLSDVWNSIWQGISNVVSSVWNGIVGFVKSGVNGIISAINGVIGGINAMADAARAVSGGAINLHVNKLPGLAKGGTIAGAGYAMVGEKGPEVVKLPHGATVYPHGTGPGQGEGGGGDTYDIDINGSNLDHDELIDAVVQGIHDAKGQ